jgi:putative two-component system response regulator
LSAEPLLVAPESPARVLAVDDQPENLELLGAILADEGFEVDFARDGEEALARVAAAPPHAVLLDIMMPKLDGFAVCARLKRSRRTCFLPVVMLTALADIGSKVRGLEAGADDFVNKPFHRLELLTRLRSLLRIRALRDELDSTEAVIFSMVGLLEEKDRRRRRHSLRVAALAAALARRLGFGAAELQNVVFGALLHDIGKIGVPEEVLQATGVEPTAATSEVYRRHAELGERILAPIESLAGALPLVRHHHERLDGSGYPDRISGAAFDLPTEIVVAANAWDTWRMGLGDDAAAAAEALRREAAAGRLHEDLVIELLAAARGQADQPPAPIDLLPVPEPATGGRIVVADDRRTNRALYLEILGGAGYEVTAVESGEEALACVRAEKPDLVLADVRMPGLSGEQLCRVLKADPEFAFLPVVLITAYEGAHARLRGLESGADEFLLAPVHGLELLARVRSLLRLRTYHRDLVRHENVVLSLSTALEAKDPHTQGHSDRVGTLAARLARELDLGEEDQAKLKTAGLLHDIGKVAVPESLLHKAGPLTPAEMDVVMTHPAIGWEICRPLASARALLDCILFHHERWDGSGYPHHLAGETIPRGARILALADALDALTSERPYRGRMSLETAVALLERETRAGKWDPEIFAALERLGRRGEADLHPAIPG